MMPLGLASATSWTHPGASQAHQGASCFTVLWRCLVAALPCYYAFSSPDHEYMNYVYGPNSAGREKSAWNGVNLPALQELPSSNGWSGYLLLLVYWLSMVGEYLTEFSPSWNARKRVQEMVKFQENPGNLYFQKTAENRLKSGKFKKIRPLLL